ncbi:nitroreductase family protein [Glacieibacterium frigidum]|uniref:Putative NAD(P)H nitroreductase n=1 Tax=Glacieibacterium frigidum TaxID=2593303 RepID=A0A552UI08_9SPHN|nr:nitroreductase family protein [Glacieibacterium frigidum]TRW17856.1 nitroreductase [Glacieibacterium frigidum]
MFNDRSTPLSLLATRRSGKARDLAAPGPTPGQLDRMLGVAMRVPDHGKLSPWAFVVIENRAAFADLLEATYRAEVADVDVGPLRAFAHQSPCLVAVLSRVVEPHKISRWEQELSVGAACGLLCAAASAMGFAANWLTGWAAYSPGVTAALGRPGDRIAGFVFIGTPTQPLDERVRPDPATVVMHWDG